VASINGRRNVSSKPPGMVSAINVPPFFMGPWLPTWDLMPVCCTCFPFGLRVRVMRFEKYIMVPICELGYRSDYYIATMPASELGFRMPKLTVDGIDIFNESRSIAIVRFLYEKGEAIAKELKEVTGNYDRMILVTERMEELGILNMEVIEKPRLTYKFTLTKKGKMIVEKLNELDKFIRS
jgi:predicted transcriptional regulator